jgi:hypothetical protein
MCLVLRKEAKTGGNIAFINCKAGQQEYTYPTSKEKKKIQLTSSTVAE